MKNRKAKTKIDLYLQNSAKTVIVFFTLVFLLFNFILSQSVSPLFFKVIKKDKEAVVVFLRNSKNLPSFDHLLTINKNIYGNSIEADVFLPDKKRKEAIARLEAILPANPASRDILYNLYLLYKDEDNTTKSEEYLTKAREIDPSLSEKD